MTLEINRRDFLQALIAAGASYTLPAKATKTQIDKIWLEAQANPWFFEVNDQDTLVEADVPEPEVWADIFDITPTDLESTADLIDEINSCIPLSSYLNRQLTKEIESLEEQLDAEHETLSKKEVASLHKKIEALKTYQDEHDEPWLDWIELEGQAGVIKFQELIEDWLTDPINWMQSEWFPVRAGAQGAAFGFFQDQPYELLDKLGVVVVEGEHRDRVQVIETSPYRYRLELIST
jgi:tellurite resistance protein